MEEVFSEVYLRNRAQVPGTPTDSAASNTEDPDLGPLYIRHRQNDVLGRIRVIASGYRLCGGGGVVRSFDPGSVTGATACLTSVCVQGDLKAAIYGEARRVLETTFFA